MKIAMFCPNYPPAEKEGGISHYTRELTRNLLSAGHRLFVVVDNDHLGPVQEAGVEALRFPSPWDKMTARRMDEVFREKGIEILNLQYSPAMYCASFRRAWPWLAKRFPSVISLHTLWGGSRWNVWVAFRMLQTATRVIATNSEIRHLIQKYLSRYERKTIFVPIASNILPVEMAEGDEAVLQRYGVQGDAPVLAYFGMIYGGKGLDALLQACGIMAKDHGAAFRLLMIGGGMEDTPAHIDRVRKLEADLGLEDKIAWTGNLPERKVSILLRACDVAVLPYDFGVSDRRGSLWAAICHGKAIVTTPPCVPVSHFRNEINMLWPEDASQSSLAHAIMRVLKDPELKQQLEKGASLLSEQFSWQRIAQDTGLVFEEALNARN